MLSETQQVEVWNVISRQYGEDAAAHVAQRILEYRPDEKGYPWEQVLHWAHKVASNWLKTQATQYGQRFRPTDFTVVEADDEPTIPIKGLAKVDAKQLDQAIAKQELARVNAKHPELVTLAADPDAQVGIPSGTVKSRRHRLRKSLGVGPFRDQAPKV